MAVRVVIIMGPTGNHSRAAAADAGEVDGSITIIRGHLRRTVRHWTAKAPNTATVRHNVSSGSSVHSVQGRAGPHRHALARVKIGWLLSTANSPIRPRPPARPDSYQRSEFPARSGGCRKRHGDVGRGGQCASKPVVFRESQQTIGLMGPDDHTAGGGGPI
jgi:hypothetical protein